MRQLTEEFKQDISLFVDCKVKIESLLEELLIHGNINFHKVESRIKSPQKVDVNMHKKFKKNSTIYQITDLVTFKIVTYFEDEVNKVASIVKNEFTLDSTNSIDKRKIETDKFGYKSLHFVVNLNDDRKNLTEYKRFKNIKFEIQIRSILQHTCAEIEHDLGYKADVKTLSNFRSYFYRIAVLLETADIEFIKIREGIKKA